MAPDGAVSRRRSDREFPAALGERVVRTGQSGQSGCDAGQGFRKIVQGRLAAPDGFPQREGQADLVHRILQHPHGRDDPPAGSLGNTRRRPTGDLRGACALRGRELGVHQRARCPLPQRLRCHLGSAGDDQSAGLFRLARDAGVHPQRGEDREPFQCAGDEGPAVVAQ